MFNDTADSLIGNWSSHEHIKTAEHISHDMTDRSNLIKDLNKLKVALNGEEKKITDLGIG